jgi:hypothetical protein
VAPKDGLSLEEWAPTPEDRHGIAYGVADIQRAKNTQHLVYDALKKKQDANSENVKSFLNEVREFFGHH